jgi:homoserine kinase type II
VYSLRADMGLFTDLSLDEAREAARDFGVDVASVEPLAAGSVNSNFRLTSTGGARFFARIYEEQREAGARAELQLLEALAAAEVPVARALRRKRGEGIALVGGKPFAIYPWVEGEILCLARVRPANTEQVGAALARLHRATGKLAELPDGRFRVEDLQGRLDRIERDGPAFAADAARIRERLNLHAGRRDPNLPAGICHGDLFRDNVLWSGWHISALLDFESASRGTFGFDLAVCLLAWCYGSRLEEGLAEAMLRGYDRVRPLEPAERESLPVEAAIAALRFATTRITDFSMRAPAGLPPERDYRRFLARLEAIEGGVLDALIAAM